MFAQLKAIKGLVDQHFPAIEKSRTPEPKKTPVPWNRAFEQKLTTLFIEIMAFTIGRPPPEMRLQNYIEIVGLGCTIKSDARGCRKLVYRNTIDVPYSRKQSHKWRALIHLLSHWMHDYGELACKHDGNFKLVEEMVTSRYSEFMNGTMEVNDLQLATKYLHTIGKL